MKFVMLPEVVHRWKLLILDTVYDCTIGKTFNKRF